MIRGAIAGAMLCLCLTLAGASAEPQASPQPQDRSADRSDPLELQWLSAVAAFAARTGPFGVIAFLGYLLRLLWVENKAKEAMIAKGRTDADAEMKARDVTIAALQEKRLADGVENARRITEVATSSAQLLADNLRNSVEWTALLRAMKERNDTVGPLFEAMSRKLDRNYRKIMHDDGAEDGA